MLNPILNPKPLPLGFRPVGASLPDVRTTGPAGRAMVPGGGAPRPAPISTFSPMGATPTTRLPHQHDGLDTATDDYASDEDDEIDDDIVDGIPPHLAAGLGGAQNVRGHRQFNTAFNPPPRQSSNPHSLPPELIPCGAELSDGRVIDPNGRPVTPSNRARPLRHAVLPSMAAAGLDRGRRISGSGCADREIANLQVVFSHQIHQGVRRVWPSLGIDHAA